MPYAPDMQKPPHKINHVVRRFPFWLIERNYTIYHVCSPTAFVISLISFCFAVSKSVSINAPDARTCPPPPKLSAIFDHVYVFVGRQADLDPFVALLERNGNFYTLYFTRDIYNIVNIFAVYAVA